MLLHNLQPQKHEEEDCRKALRHGHFTAAAQFIKVTTSLGTSLHVTSLLFALLHHLLALWELSSWTYFRHLLETFAFGEACAPTLTNPCGPSLTHQL